MAAHFNWLDYLTLAEELSRRQDEASLRSAVSRAYYYVYHLALQRAKANDFIARPDEGTHKQLWRLYNGSPEAACQSLARIANRLKERREQADYNPAFEHSEEEVAELIEDARKFSEKLTELPARHPNPRSVRI